MSKPDLSCDLVMKGGITSGVVYPKAVTVLARQYRFHNIGGTSAGAIAAVITAAAEYGRVSGGFEKIEQLPDELSTTLLDKFQPVPSLRPLFKVLLAVLSRKPIAIIAALLKGYWKAALLGAIPALIVALLAIFSWHSWVGGMIAIFLLFVFCPFVSSIAALLHIRAGLPAADFGMCNGRTQPYMPKDHPALTDWLADMIDQVAGLPRGAAPLGVMDLKNQEIVVKTVTTDIATHRPYVLPMDNNLHFFSKKEFLTLFPARIVDAMTVLKKEGSDDLYYFHVENLPLVVLARMSLSFPALISAVPLYRVDHTLQGADEEQRLVRCLFSDGGLSSNFPIHFFDHFLPSRPTFGISLGEYNPLRERAGSLGETRVELPSAARSGQLLPTYSFHGIGGFFSALFSSAKDWQDTLQSVLAGYRERIVTVRLKKEEGGLNLEMPKTLIDLLTGFGQEAGTVLTGDFDPNEHKCVAIWSRCAPLMTCCAGLLMPMT